MTQIYNFSAGPAKIPEAVMQRAHKEFFDWHGVGSSIMEISHRGDEFISVAHKAEHDLRELLDVPDNYQVLFLQGGAQLQNAAIPMNIMGEYACANYLETGLWSTTAALEAKKYTRVTCVADSAVNQFHTVAPRDQWQIDRDGAYFYYCDNETVHGIEFHDRPDVDLPVVADMSSNLFTRKVDIAKYGLIFACSQKNFGPSGLTIVIVSDALLKREPRIYTPSVIEYRTQVAKHSMKNTPPTFSWYMAGLVFEWLKEQGGVEVMDQLAKKRSQLVYDFLDSSAFYDCPVDPAYRSRMNVVFDLKDTTRDESFVTAAHKAGLHYLKGHRARGGMRASMYNAMPLAGAEKLVEFLESFAS